MKKNYVLFAMLLSSIFFCSAQTFEVKNVANEPLELTFRLPSYTSQQKTVGGQNYEDFSALKSILMLQKEAPALPMFSESLQVPDTGAFSVEISYDSFEEYLNVEILPSKGSLKRNVNPETIPYTKGEVFNQDAFFPGSLAQLGNPYILRQTRGVTVSFYPFQYNPVTKTLRVYRNITAKIIHQPNEIGLNERSVLAPKSDEVFAPFYRNHYANALQYQSMQEQGQLLIVCPPTYRNVIESLANWKKEKGIATTVIELTQPGVVSSFDIKGLIQAQYEANPDLVYVLLIGDHEQLPSHNYGFNGEENLYSDSFYGQLEGADFYPELFVGRFSGNLAQVLTMVNRTLEYEISPLPGDWMTNAIGIGSNEGYGYGDDGEADWQHLRNIKTKLQAFGYNTVHEFYEGSQGESDSPGNPSSTMIVNALNQGTGLMNYTGHGWTEGVSTGDFTNSAVNQLTNSGKYPFVVSVACNNGTFVSNTSLCESFLCAKQGSDITGAIASCGSSILMAWAEPMQTQDEMTELIIQSDENTRMTTLGGLFYNGQLSMLEAYDQSNTAIEVMQTWVFFGDPSVVFRNQISQAITAIHPEEVSINGGVISVGSNVAEANVTLTQNNIILFNGTMVNNEIQIDLASFTSEDVVKVTLTKPNMTPYRGEITVNEALSLSDFENGFVIYPNPAKDVINIKSNRADLGFASLKLFDLNGRMLANYDNVSLDSDYSISVQNLLSGIYVLSIQNGDFQKNQKIVVK